MVNNESEYDRSPIKKVTYDEKEDTHNSESHAQEKVNSSDVDSLDDDDNVPFIKKTQNDKLSETGY